MSVDIVGARAPWASALSLLLMVSCGTKEDADGDSGNDSSPMSDSSSGGMIDPTNPTPTSSTGSDDVMGGTNDDGNDTSGGIAFIADPDGGGATNECDVWAQDCPEGEKCMPWANDGGGSWNATRCSPLDDNPGQPGDECGTEGGGVSGVDNCAVSSMCWDVDGETNLGTCVPFCEGSIDNPLCSDPDDACSITNEGVLILCLPKCDPLLQDCVQGQACYPEENGFICSPDASGEGGNTGESCAFINGCSPGNACYGEEAWPGGCGGGGGCCIPFCDLSDPMPDCPPGTECQAIFELPDPGEEDFGICGTPP